MIIKRTIAILSALVLVVLIVWMLNTSSTDTFSEPADVEFSSDTSISVNQGPPATDGILVADQPLSGIPELVAPSRVKPTPPASPDVTQPANATEVFSASLPPIARSSTTELQLPYSTQIEFPILTLEQLGAEVTSSFLNADWRETARKESPSLKTVEFKNGPLSAVVVVSIQNQVSTLSVSVS